MKKLIMALSLCAVVGGPLAAEGGRLEGLKEWWNSSYDSEVDGDYFNRVRDRHEISKDEYESATGDERLYGGVSHDKSGGKYYRNTSRSFYKNEDGATNWSKVRGAVPAGYRYAMDASFLSDSDTSDTANSFFAEGGTVSTADRVKNSVTPRTMISSAALAGLMAHGAQRAHRGDRTWLMEKLAKSLEGREGALAQKLERALNTKAGRYTGNLLERYVQWALINMLLNRGAYKNSATVPYTLGAADAAMAGARGVRGMFTKKES